MAFDWVKHDVYLAWLVMQRASLIRNESGYGTIVVDFRHGTMISCKSTVRDHPPKTLQEGDSHNRSAEVEGST